ncbi:MAG: glycosyltransferase family 4 protein, partial [Elusimicrobiota bacterium]
MKKHKITWVCDVPNWTFDFVSRNINRFTSDKFEIERVYMKSDDFKDNLYNNELVLCPDVNQAEMFFSDYDKAVVIRLSGMRTFSKNRDENHDFHAYDDTIKKNFIVATNTKLYNVAKRVKDDNIWLIPNPVDLDLFKPTPKKNDDFVVGIPANLDHSVNYDYKGVKYVLKATQELGIRLKLTSYDRKKKKENIPYKKMNEEFYSKIDCMALPSIGEGCSNATMEALACGVPVLITPIGYHGERLKDKHNCLMVERDKDNVKQAIKYLIDNPKKAKEIGEAGRKFAEEHHDPEIIG